MKLKKISIIMIIFIAFMSIATASAMDDSSSVSLDDSSNYNASDLELNLGDAGSNLLSSQDSISSEDSDDLASTSHEEFESANLMRELAIPTVLDQIQMFYLVLTLMYCLAAVQMCSLQASL